MLAMRAAMAIKNDSIRAQLCVQGVEQLRSRQSQQLAVFQS